MNGFTYKSPAARYGASETGASANLCGAQKYTPAWEGTKEVSEMGVWLFADASQTARLRLSIWTHDATNDCPESMVANSETDEISTTSTSVVKISHTYAGTKPQVTGGTTYWIVIYYADANGNIDLITTGGTRVTTSAATYPTWPTGAQWEAASPATNDISHYAVTLGVGEERGFVSEVPTFVWGELYGTTNADMAGAEKLVCPGTGSREITEIGGWFSADVATTTYLRLAIFTHDAGNNCPDTMVSNSESAELSTSSETPVKLSHTYSTKPILTGGTTYWLVWFSKDVNMNRYLYTYEAYDKYLIAATTYPTWPSPANWDGATEALYAYSTYALVSDVIRYVDPDADSGGNGITNALSSGDNTHAYQTLSAWNTARARDITSGTGDDSIERVICASNQDAGGGTADTTNFTMSGWSTSSTNYIEIIAASPHLGKWNDNIYRHITTDGTSANIRFQLSNVRMRGIQFYRNLTTQSGNFCIIWFEGVSGETNAVEASGCIFRGNPAFNDTAQYGGWCDYSSFAKTGLVKLYNNLFYDFKNAGTGNGRGIWNYTNVNDHDIYNNTFQNCDQGIVISANLSGQQPINNLFSGCTTDITGSGYKAGSGYNATNNGTLTYTVSGGATADRVSQTFSFAYETYDDFHLNLDDTGAKGYGLADPSSGDFSDDFDGQTRYSSPWDIGADQAYVNIGFLPESPTLRGTRREYNQTANMCLAQKFTCPGSGTKYISEIGCWLSAVTATTAYFHLAIFTHDAGNNNPDTIVANSDSGELSHNTTAITKISHIYSTKPQLTGGTVYWIVWYFKDTNANNGIQAAGGTLNYYTGATYPTWPSAAQWDSGTDGTTQADFYAVYKNAVADMKNLSMLQLLQPYNPVIPIPGVAV